MSVSRTVRAIEDGTKIDTRRDGWLFLKPGDVVELIEWSPRVGKRVCCDYCRRLFGKTRTGGLTWMDCGLCGHCGHSLIFRGPRRLGFRTVKSVRRERLGAITAQDVAREGFPGKTPEWFVAFYCQPKPPDPDRMVTRIEFELTGAQADRLIQDRLDRELMRATFERTDREMLGLTLRNLNPDQTEEE